MAAVSAPENLGYPINSPEDDVFFIDVRCQRYAYLHHIVRKDLWR
ncbi:MAG: hypothetical protein R2850_05625 [Bacteroidia bacterium]